MQIRIGNKQDEPACRELAKGCALEAGIRFDLEEHDADLKNIELSYIGRDGIFLVVEEEQEVIAFAAAARDENESICLLRRLYVAWPKRGQGIGRKLIDQIVFFAKNLDYKTLLVEADKLGYSGPAGEAKSKQLSAVDFLTRMAFKLQDENSESTVYERVLS